MLQMEVPEEVRRKIQATPFPCVARNEDKLAWNPSPKSSFDLRSTFLLASEPLPNPAFQGKWIWKLDTLPRIQTFIWKCTHKSIGVRDCLQARGIQVDNICPHYHNSPKSILYTLQNCQVLKRIWHQLGISYQDTDSFRPTSRIGLCLIVEIKGSKIQGKYLGTKPLCLLYGSFGREGINWYLRTRI